MLTNPNIVVLITDQQRHERHWPAGWSEKNLPTMHRLRRHGLTFHNYITAVSRETDAGAASRGGVADQHRLAGHYGMTSFVLRPWSFVLVRADKR